MKRTHCEGCGITVPMGQEAEHDIRDTTVTVAGLDAREWAQRRDEKSYSADLCGVCREQLLVTFFAVPARVDAEIPAFILPTPAIR